MTAHFPLRLRIDGDALVSNWRWLASMSGGAMCGAAVKAHGYGIGARETVERLAAAGCRDFFVATWAEAEALMPWVGKGALSVLHGVGPDDMESALGSPARPVLNSIEQVARWRESGQGRPCDVMVDTGMNRLGLTPEQALSGLLDGFGIETLMSHLACGDEDSPRNARQRDALVALGGKIAARRLSLSNSAGICLGTDYALGLTRPGLALYGGVPRREAEGHIRQVVTPEARVVQRRRVAAGESVGYGATFTAGRETELAILNVGYADGYLRAFSGTGHGRVGDALLPVVGRVSMDLTAVCVDAAPALREGDWMPIDYHLPDAAKQSALSQYELLTSLGPRYQRIWS